MVFNWNLALRYFIVYSYFQNYFGKKSFKISIFWFMMSLIVSDWKNAKNGSFTNFQIVDYKRKFFKLFFYFWKSIIKYKWGENKILKNGHLHKPFNIEWMKAVICWLLPPKPPLQKIWQPSSRNFFAPMFCIKFEEKCRSVKKTST